MVSFKKLRQMIEIQGNGTIVSKEMEVSSYLRLHIATQGTTELIQSSEEKVVIETDENILEYFTAQNAGRTLFVSLEANLRKLLPTKCNIKIYVRQLNVLVVRCENGNVISNNPIVVTDPLDIKIQSVGNTELNFDAPSVKFVSQSVGNVALKGKYDSIDVKIQSVGNTEMDLDASTIKLKSQTQGNVTLKGKCESIDINNQSQGDFSSIELIAQDLKIKNMAQGNVEVFADKNISIAHYGNTLYFKGDAKLNDVKQHGSGIIKHIN